jgi:hypothetical protein
MQRLNLSYALNRSNRLPNVLVADQPLWRLHEELQYLFTEEYNRETLRVQLEGLRQYVRCQRRDADEDMILDAVDFLSSWCRPGLEL